MRPLLGLSILALSMCVGCKKNGASDTLENKQPAGAEAKAVTPALKDFVGEYKFEEGENSLLISLKGDELEVMGKQPGATGAHFQIFRAGLSKEPAIKPGFDNPALMTSTHLAFDESTLRFNKIITNTAGASNTLHQAREVKLRLLPNDALEMSVGEQDAADKPMKIEVSRLKRVVEKK